MPAGLNADLLKQDDLRVVPGEVGVQVFVNGEAMPVTAERATPLPVVPAWSYPSGADVAGWLPVLSALSDGGPATGPVGPGTLYAGYAPAGSFAADRLGPCGAAPPGVRMGGAVRRRQGTGLTRPRGIPLRPHRSAARAGRVGALAAAIVGRPRRTSRAKVGEP